MVSALKLVELHYVCRTRTQHVRCAHVSCLGGLHEGLASGHTQRKTVMEPSFQPPAKIYKTAHGQLKKQSS